MKKSRLFLYGLAVMAAFTLFLASCDDNTSNVQPSSSRLEVYLTDAPGDYQAVWIDVQKIMVNVGADSVGDDGWVEAPLLRPGLYNLLDFRNGKDTILAAVDLPAGKVSQIRLVLGDNNSLVLNDGTEIKLTTPSAQQSGLKLNIHATLEAGIPYALVLDFDAARSIVKAGNSGKYLLKPVIRTFAKAAGGAIEGVVLPSEAKAYVLALQDEDTVGSAIPDTEGAYKFWGMPAGAYQLVFAPDTATAYLSDTLSNVAVQVGEVTKVDTVILAQ